MPKGAVKLGSEVAEKVRQLLGGQNPTPKRIEKLMTELEQRRAVDPSADASPAELLAGPTIPERPAPLPDPEPEDDEIEDLAEPVRQATPLVVGKATPLPGPPSDWEAQKDMLIRTIQSLEKKIDEIKKPALPEERDQAIGMGQLPPPSVKAAPLGFPTSPLGPKVFYRVCDCQKCTPFRVFHWFCVICRSGPHAYLQRYPHFTKNWYAAGNISGVAHHCCSESCRMQYLGLIGVIPGVNDAEPPVPVGPGAEPSRPNPAFDSD